MRDRNTVFPGEKKKTRMVFAGLAVTLLGFLISMSGLGIESGTGSERFPLPSRKP